MSDAGQRGDGREARPTSDPSPRPRRVVGLVDTDSFAKWGAHLLATAPAHWSIDLVTIATPRTASPTQLRSAFRGLAGVLGRVADEPPAPRDVDSVLEELREDPPDAVLVSLIGPVAELVIEEVHRRVPDRPVLVTGLPGISFPAKWKGVFFRARADLFVLHSHRERRAYESLASEGGVVPHFALSTLPFARRTPERPIAASAPLPLPQPRAGESAPHAAAGPTGSARSRPDPLPAGLANALPHPQPRAGESAPHAAAGPTGTARSRPGRADPDTAPGRDSVVFAAQPSVPADLADRRRIVRWLADTARAHPRWRVVIKTRASAGEQQTHREQYPYPDLLPEDAPANLVVETGPMAEHLERAVALVTVSSTAVLEAVALGVPALTLTDFGVARHLINEVFVDSGLEGDARDLVDGRFGQVRASWMQDNYFHPRADDDWVDRAEALMGLRDAGTLEDRPAARRSRGGALRRAWERRNALGSADRSALGVVALVIGTPVRSVKRAGRAVRRAFAADDLTANTAPPRSQRGPAPEPAQRGPDPERSEGLRHRQEELVARRDPR